MHLNLHFRFVPQQSDIDRVQAQTLRASRILCDATDCQMRIGTMRLLAGGASEPSGDIWYAPPGATSRSSVRARWAPRSRFPSRRRQQWRHCAPSRRSPSGAAVPRGPRSATGISLRACVELFVVRAGPPDGPPVVLLHGFPEFWYAWKGVIAPLTHAGHRVIIPDQRGYGDSDKPRGVESYGVDWLGDDIANLIAALGYENAFVAAHDWGGGVAWNLAIRHPERVRKLAVIDTPHPDAYEHGQSKQATVSWFRTFFQIPLLPEETARWGNWALQSKMLRDTAAPGAFPDEELDLYRSAWDRDGAYASMVNWYRASFRRGPGDGKDARVAFPVLLILTANDAFIPADMTRASLSLLDDGQLVELGSGTHWVLQEEPDRIAQLLAEFFAL